MQYMYENNNSKIYYETLVKNTMFTPKLKIFTYHDILVVGTTPRSVGYT